MYNHGVIGVPKDLMGMDSYIRFKNEFLEYPPQRELNEFEKFEMRRAIQNKGNKYTRISSELWLCEFMDIPRELVKSIEFVSEYRLAITFYESEEFCVEKYFQINFDVIKDKNFIIKYLNKEGYIVRTDSYKVTKLSGIEREPLTNEIKSITVKITLECSNHDISTCKE